MTILHPNGNLTWVVGGRTMEMSKEHFLWVRDSIFPLFGKGKDLEVRVESPTVRNIGVGDILIFNEKLRRLVKAVRRYKNFEEMLMTERPERILPGYDKEQIISLLRHMYRSRRENMGVVVFELQDFIERA